MARKIIRDGKLVAVESNGLFLVDMRFMHLVPEIKREVNKDDWDCVVFDDFCLDCDIVDVIKVGDAISTHGYSIIPVFRYHDNLICGRAVISDEYANLVTSKLFYENKFLLFPQFMCVETGFGIWEVELKSSIMIYSENFWCNLEEMLICTYGKVYKIVDTGIPIDNLEIVQTRALFFPNVRVLKFNLHEPEKKHEG